LAASTSEVSDILTVKAAEKHDKLLKSRPSPQVLAEIAEKEAVPSWVAL
jgi:hypothetical protein